MVKRTDIKNILILGAGPIVIGQACEFDYAGVQACKALREIGYRVILVNSNPATIMTDPNLANATYIEPINWKVVRKIIEKERPDTILPTMGGQTALNCALELDRHGVLKEFSVKMIGAIIDSIDKAENRHRFDKAMQKIGLETARSGIAHSFKEALEVVKKVGFPCIIRPSFTMGGSGSGIAYDYIEFKHICLNALDLSPIHELLIDESLIGWKEYEMEVLRDKNDNCIIICSIENIDSMGIHTGDSIAVAPAQTLTDKEYQIMRNASIAVLREIGIETGGSNVQFAVNPNTGRLIVVEMNPRVSRSSALASKATGFPIAKIAAKLAVGYTLDELMNDIAGSKIPAAIEPVIDYVVTKIPYFNFEKFPGSNDRLTTQMKSVGEVMAIGRTFQESIHKALRGLEIDATGFDSKINLNELDSLKKIYRELKEAGADRIWYIADAFRAGMSVDKIFYLTNIDRWFLIQIKELIMLENKVIELGIDGLSFDFLRILKRKGFSDIRLAKLLNISESKIRELRYKYKLHPVFKRVDTCAAEFAINTTYLYSTYEDECEANPDSNKLKVIILGGGPNRIGQGIEFDYCCVHAALALSEDGYQTIMVNCNPETVSTDTDISDRLYFEPVTLEDVLEIVRVEQPIGVIVQFGGQTPLKLASLLEREGVPIIGTSPDAIDRAEDRNRFQQVVVNLALKQPKNATVNTIDEAIEKANSIGYPLVVRPSYVLGGRAMSIVYNKIELYKYFNIAISVSNNTPVLLDHFLDNAIEVDVDAICDGKTVFIGGIMEHIELAGVHSGDSACSLPSYTLTDNIQNIIRDQVKKLAIELRVKGLLNVQFAVKDNDIYLIEVNPRATRTVPFVSKAIGIPLAKVAARVMIGQSLTKQKMTKEIIPPYYSVKEVVLPFNKFSGVDPILGPEMRSTGEVMGIGRTFAEAFAKAILSCSFIIKKSGRVLLSVKKNDKLKVVDLAIKLLEYGFKLDATYDTAIMLGEGGINTCLVNKINDNYLTIHDKIKNGEYTYILNTIDGSNEIEISKMIRLNALRYKVYYNTTINGSIATVISLNADPTEKVISIQEMYKMINY
ncbi:Carbamoyl-phosphate synthase large chain [Candidatus Arsenophonus lipoptenae]|uniref:Carbamoyl phosphate synthase large chain n=1 Tax=Candidatus Arsenophonus lipoptenae TaxID=634113 RepID=A0A0X8CXS3_9GAMM|nr:carbamoyl-phosphate synthase large subunit [Candidatus Arsenophonus lipoptenae]AMA64842.1 Carbamoyl-phosphate synthase large chain [Candidatus Arsenophonus lipoptenae]